MPIAGTARPRPEGWAPPIDGLETWMFEAGPEAAVAAAVAVVAAVAATAA